MQLLFATNYSLLNALVETIEAHAVEKEYKIVKKRSKASYKFDAITKVDIICKRNNESQRKLGAKQRKIASIKCDCSFRVNFVYKQSLNM